MASDLLPSQIFNHLLGLSGKRSAVAKRLGKTGDYLNKALNPERPEKLGIDQLIPLYNACLAEGVDVSLAVREFQEGFHNGCKTFQLNGKVSDEKERLVIYAGRISELLLNVQDGLVSDMNKRELLNLYSLFDEIEQACKQAKAEIKHK